jgi:O-antigen ligase
MTGTAHVFDQPPRLRAMAPPSPATFRLTRQTPRHWPGPVIMAATLAVALLSPIPSASNQPLAWMFWATILGAAGALLVWAKGGILPTGPLRPVLVVALVFVGFALFQAAPFPGWRGGISVDLPAGPVTFGHLSIAPSATFLAALRLTSYVVFFTLMLHCARDARRAKTIGWVLFLGVGAQALYAIAALEMLGDSGLLRMKTAYAGMATGTFVNKNSLATYLGMGLVLGLALLGKKQPRAGSVALRIRRGLGIAALITILVALILSRSRMGIAASLTAALIVVLRARLALGAAWVGAIVASTGATALASLWYLDQLAARGADGSSRLELYRQVAAMIRTRPLTGFGLDSFPLAYQMFHAPPVTAGFVWDKAHSTYLTLWAEAGVILGSLPIVAAGIVALLLWRAQLRPAPGQSMALAGFAALLLGGLHSLVDFSLEIQANAFLLLALIALGLAGTTHSKGKT